MSKITVARALTAHVARRMIKLATIIAFILFAAIVLIIGLLAYFFSGWWWLAVIPFVVLLTVFLVIRLLVLVIIINRIHSVRLTKAQGHALDTFVEKIEAVIEARSTPLPIMVLICVKDVVFHRDITTIKKLIKDSIGLQRDYQELEKLF